MEIITLMVVVLAIFMGILALFMPYFVYKTEANTNVTMKEMKKINEKLSWIIDNHFRPTEVTSQRGEKEKSNSQPTKQATPNDLEKKASNMSDSLGDKGQETVTLLPDDPKQPTIAKAKCNICNHVMPYAKRLSGKDVTCRNCGQPFTLP